MIKIAHIITGLDTGGAEMMLYKLLSGTDRDRFDPAVLSLSGLGALGGRIEALGVPVIDVGMDRGRLSPAGIRRLIARVRRLEPDIVQGWMIHGNAASALAGWITRKRVVWNVRHSNLPKETESRGTVMLAGCLSWLSSRPGKIIYNSDAGRSYHESIGYDRRKSIVIPNGFDTTIFAPSPASRSNVRRELALSDRELLIGMVGRYHPMKDHPTFLGAAARTAAEFPSVRFVLAGRGCDRHNAGLLSLLRELRLLTNVFLLGDRPDIPDVTAALDIAASSSCSSEGFSNAVGEAMSCGVPCVVTDVGDSSRIVGDAGIVIPARDPEALHRAWKYLLERGDAYRAALGERARRRIMDAFSIQHIVRRYEALYEEVLA